MQRQRAECEHECSLGQQLIQHWCTITVVKQLDLIKAIVGGDIVEPGKIIQGQHLHRNIPVCSEVRNATCDRSSINALCVTFQHVEERRVQGCQFCFGSVFGATRKKAVEQQCKQYYRK